MIEAGKILQERYRIDKQIGQGGMGAVYVATDQRFGSTVAIKETLCMDDNYRKAIEREARLLNSLKHVALPRVSDHFLESNGQFLVMEFIPGEDLSCILEERREAFPVDQVLKWADQLLDALEFLHTQEIPVIHRDIKPQNLKLTSRGQIILLDFGLAKGNPTDAGHQTAAKSIFGYSRNYASLEQIQGTGTDPRSDLYSLAATLYHLITGVAPEDALTRAMSVLSQQPDPLIPAHQLRPALPRGISGILQNAMDLNAAQRPVSALKMREMLANHASYIHLADAEHTTARPTEDDPFAKKTQILQDDTHQIALNQTEVKTEVLPANLSQVTAFRIPNTDDLRRQIVSNADESRTGSGRKFAIAAGGLGAILLAGSIAAGVYVFGPGRTSGTEIPVAEVPDVPQPPEPANIVSNEMPVSTADAASSVQSDSTITKPVTETKPADAETSAKKSETTAPQTNTDPDTIIVEGDNVYIGNKKISPGRIETPDEVIELNEPPVPPTVYPRPQQIPPDMRNLTPEQRRKLRRLRQQNPQVRVRPTPYQK
ncbi:MAG: serine/threonine protein kinase [Blastocatellia bacterium]